MKQEPINKIEMQEYYSTLVAKNLISIPYSLFEKIVRMTETHHDIHHHDEAQDALENIEQEIIARACRNGVCED
jgi:hypothetical protein